MAKLLYRLGLWSATNKKKVVFSTIGLFIVLSLLLSTLGSKVSDVISIPNTPADKAITYISKEFGQAAGGGNVKIVFKAPNGKSLVDDGIKKNIEQMLSTLNNDKNVISVISPFQLESFNQNQMIAIAQVTYKQKAEEVTKKSKEHILNAIELTRKQGIKTELTGDVKFTESEMGGKTEAIGVIAAYLILAITFVSFSMAGLPILLAITGLGLGILTIIIGTNFFEIQSASFSLAAMLGLAVGIDYALFIMVRFKHQLSIGNSVVESAAMAIGTAGSAVFFAGITVIIGLLGLSVTGIPFLTAMGASAALCVAFSVFASLFVLPAILGFVGNNLSHHMSNKFLSSITKPFKSKKWKFKWSAFITKRPLVTALVMIALLGVISMPFTHMNLGLPSDGTSKSTDTTERRAYDLLKNGFGEGFNAPLVVVVKSTVGEIVLPTQIKEVTKTLTELKNVAIVSQAMPSPSGQAYLVQVIPTTGPDDPKTKVLVKAIRAESTSLKDTSNIDLMVTGNTAINIDVSDKLNNALPVFASLIVVLAFILLVMVFRSLLLPLKAVFGFLLSLGATLGFVVFVVQDGNFINFFGFPSASPIIAFLPVILIGILFGLAMDYEVFLVSKMREDYVHTGDAKQAILDGLKHSGAVVVAAGLIMTAVFIGFMLAPDPIIKSMGLALAFGVIFDAFVVRLTIVPAVMKMMGEWAWYLPKWLDRILPNIDIEGEALSKNSNIE